MAKPSATNNKIDPKLTPVNKAPKRSPVFKAPSMAVSDFLSCAFTCASVSCAKRSFKRSCVSGVWLSAKRCAASKRTAISASLSKAAALANWSKLRIWASCSCANALFNIGNLLASGSLSKAFAACLRILSSLLNSFKAANAVSISLRNRLLLTTSCALAGKSCFCPVRGSSALPAPKLSRTIQILSPATFTASSANACKNTKVFSSPCATTLFRASIL